MFFRCCPPSSETAVVMSKKPLSTFGRIFDYKSFAAVAIEAVIMAAATLVAFSTGKDFGTEELATTMAFATLCFAQLFHCYNNKFEGTLLNGKIFGNKMMNFAVLGSFLAVLLFIFTPLGGLFSLTTLTFNEFITCLSLGFVIIPVAELVKIIFND